MNAPEIDKTEYLDVVDSNDKVLYQEKRVIIDEKKLLHRSVLCFIINSKKELFVHQRTFTKRVFPGYFDVTVGGAVGIGESYYDAIKRELLEEVELFGKIIRFLFDFRYDGEQCKFIGKIFLVKHDGKMKLQKEEIIDGRFMSIAEIEQMIAKGKKFCPDGLEVFEKLKIMIKENKL
ncbi:NUDIX domain-containing protein [Candidatus Woesearchaeota archaeon]|nr:NUDIX domain-containing protein [Candidatus Woesearchaeota archaeon]